MKYIFSCWLSAGRIAGHIVTSEGHCIMLGAQEIPNILLDLSVDVDGQVGREKHYQMVLSEWYARKTAPIRPRLRLVS